MRLHRAKGTPYTIMPVTLIFHVETHVCRQMLLQYRHMYHQEKHERGDYCICQIELVQILVSLIIMTLLITLRQYVM
jgi:hypothetical protein